MTAKPETTARKQRGRPFVKGQSGNPAGRPKGSRHRATVIAQQLLDGEAEALTRKAIDLALAGDVQALKVCIERLVPPRKDRPVEFNLSPLETAADATKAIAALLSAVATGQITPDEAASAARLIDIFLRGQELVEIEQRLRALEQRGDDDGEGA